MLKSGQELVEFLKERTLLKVLDERVLEGIQPLFQEIHCGPGHLVFKQGDQSDALYFIADGSVEVVQSREGGQPKVIAYLTAGDCFGEMGILHDTARNATIRVPEEALILRLSRKACMELTSHFPQVTRELTKLADRRQSGKPDLHSPGLQGNLAFFDLPTVVQTVVGSRQSGILSLRGRAGKLLAQVHFRSGKISQASCMHLTGEPAMFELLTRTEPLDFLFEQSDPDPSVPADKALAAYEPYRLLMEGARRADELPKLMAKCDWPSAVFAPTGGTPDWSTFKGAWTQTARRIWFLIEANISVQDISLKLPYDRHTILDALAEMLDEGIISGGTKKSNQAKAEIHDPSEIAQTVSAINAVSVSLQTILGREIVHRVLKQALRESMSSFANLSSLAVMPETATLDLRLAKPDVSQSETSFKSLQYLTVTFLRLAADAGKPD